MSLIDVPLKIRVFKEVFRTFYITKSYGRLHNYIFNKAKRSLSSQWTPDSFINISLYVIDLVKLIAFVQIYARITIWVNVDNTFIVYKLDWVKDAVSIHSCHQPDGLWTIILHSQKTWNIDWITASSHKSDTLE